MENINKAMKKLQESKALVESKFDKCQATLPLSNTQAMGIIISNDGETVQYMYSNDENSVYESDIEYNEEGRPYFKDEEGEEWFIDEFMRTNYGEKKEIKTEDKYGEGIFGEIENALEEAGLNPSRFSDDGTLTKNIGWTVYGSNGEKQQISCDGSWLEEGKLLESDGWIAFYNGNKVEITKDEANDLWGAKQVAIKKLNVPKSKTSLVAVEPAYNESKTLLESDATPEFLEDLKNLINRHLGVGQLKELKLVDGEELGDHLKGEEYIIADFGNGAIKRINVTAESNIQIARDILFHIS